MAQLKVNMKVCKLVAMKGSQLVEKMAGQMDYY